MKTTIHTHLSLFAMMMGLITATATIASAQTTVFFDDFENGANDATLDDTIGGYSQTPDVDAAQSNGNTSGGVNSTLWVKANQGFGATRQGLVDESHGDFTDPVGEQAWAFRYTNSGLTSADGVIGPALAGVTYTVTYDVVEDGHNSALPFSVKLVTFNGGARNDTRDNNDSTKVLTTDGGSAPGGGAYQSESFSYTVDPITDASVLGHDLAVRFIGATSSAIIDNVKVEADYSALAYWDTDGTTAGSGGATPSGIWDAATANWNTLPDGTATTGAWTPGLTAVFAAGSDATGTYTLTVDGSQDISGLFVEEGSLTLADGTSGALNMTASSNLIVSPGADATIEAPFTDTSGTEVLTKVGDGTLTLNADNSGATGGMALNGGVTQFETPASINGTTENATIGSAGTMAFGASFGAGNIPTALADRIDPASDGTVAADNYDTTAFDFDTPGLTSAYFGAVGSVNYTGSLTPNGTDYRLGGGGGTLTLNSALTSTNSLDIKGPGTVQLNGFDATMGNLSGTGGILQNGHATTAVTLSANSTTNTLLSTLLEDGGAASLALEKNGSQQLTVSNQSNSFSGGTTINAGEVVVYTDSLGTGDITLNGGGIRASRATGTLTNNVHVNSGVTAGVASSNQYYSIYLDGVVSGDDTTSLEFSKGTSNGAGQVGIRNAGNTFTGTLITRAPLQLRSMPDSTQPIQLLPVASNRSAGLDLLSGTASPLNFATRQLQLKALGTVQLRNNNGTASNTITIADLVVDTGSSALLLDLDGSNSGDNTISSAIADGTSSSLRIEKDGTGKWVLTGGSSYTGATDVLRGTLSIDSIADYGVNSAIGAPASGGIQLGRNDGYNGTLLYTGAGNSTNRNIEIGHTSNNYSGSALIINDGTGALTFTAATFNAAVAGVADDRSLTLGGSYAGGVNEIQGVIQDNDAGTTGYVGLTKTGASTWVLGGTNTYTGATTVSDGTLLINGSTVAASAVAVNGTGTLGGNGTIGGTVSVAAGANLAPGASAGTLSIGGDIDLFDLAGGAGLLYFELNTPGTSDQIAVTGELGIGVDTLGFTDFVFTDLGGLENGTYTLITSGSITALDSLDPADLSGSIGAGTGTLQISGSDIELVVSGLVGASSPYDTWETANSLAGGPTVDEESDGLVNLLEFGFGTDPNGFDNAPLNPDGSVNGLPVAQSSGGGGGVTFDFLFVRRDDHGTSGSVTYTVQFSGDLFTFHDSGATPTLVVDSSDDAAYEVVSIPYPATLPDGKKARFARVKVVQVP